MKNSLSKKVEKVIKEGLEDMVMSKSLLKSISLNENELQTGDRVVL